jgi:glycosyltransferase involved in cell wall biosynthesis
MPKTLRVISVGPALSVQGGISRVIGMIKGHLPDHIRFYHVATFTRYTGSGDAHSSDLGNRLAQTLVFCHAYAQVLAAAIYQRSVFHVHFSNGGSILRKGLICIMLRLLKCHYVVHAHAADTDLFHSWLPQSIRRMLLWGIGGAERLIALTQHWHDHYSASLKLPSSRLLLLPNPADLPSSIPDRAHREGIKLLFLGRIGERKGAFDLIRAFAALPDSFQKRCNLMLVGDGDVDAAKKLIVQLGCSRLVAVSGWVGAAEVDRLLAEADIFMLPSYAEGMAMSLVEAMSWGLAVVTSGVGGAGEFLEHRCNSMLVSPGDVQGISNAICELANNPELRLRLGLAARETISRFSIDTYVATLCELYEDLASGSQRGFSGKASTRTLSGNGS